MQLFIHGLSEKMTRVVMMYYCRREVFVRTLIREVMTFLQQDMWMQEMRLSKVL